MVILDILKLTLVLKIKKKNTFTYPYDIFSYRRLPFFGLCNGPATFQRCMIVIFYDMVERFIEIFMYDFYVFGSSLVTICLLLKRVLQRCERLTCA